MTLAILLLCVAILCLEISRIVIQGFHFKKAMAHQKEVEDATGLTAALEAKKLYEAGGPMPGFVMKMPKGRDA